MVEQAVKEYGQIDVLVNNAGVLKDGPLLRMSEEDWDSVMNVCLKGAFLCSQTVPKRNPHSEYARRLVCALRAALPGCIGMLP